MNHKTKSLKSVLIENDGFVDYYLLLGVDPDATTRAIRKAWLKKNREYHPDFHTNESDQDKYSSLTQAVNEAYEILTDRERRKKYDAIRQNYLNAKAKRERELLEKSKKTSAGTFKKWRERLKMRAFVFARKIFRFKKKSSADKKSVPAPRKNRMRQFLQSLCKYFAIALAKFLKYLSLSLLVFAGALIVAVLFNFNNCGNDLKSFWNSFVEREMRVAENLEPLAGTPTEHQYQTLLGFEFAEIPGNDYCLMGKCEITQAQWQMVGLENPSRLKMPNVPVNNISWLEAREFCKRLTQLARERGAIGENQKFRLPTPQEWFAAARAGTRMSFAGCDTVAELADFAWVSSNAEQRPHAVAEKMPNACGLFDMSGNVWEWCESGDAENFAFLRGGSFAVADCELWQVLRKEKIICREDWGLRIVLVDIEREKEAAQRAIVPALVEIPNQNYKIAKTEITRYQWNSLMKPALAWFGDDVPAGNISWNAANEYCKKLTQFARERALIASDEVFRLPTNDEFTLACVHQNESEDWAKNSQRGWTAYNSNGNAHFVAESAPNFYGIFDMHGNMLELTAERSARGTSYFHGEKRDCNFAATKSLDPQKNDWTDLGFRVVLAKEKKSVPAPAQNIVPALAVVSGIDFSISKFEITQNQYAALMSQNPSRFRGGDLPVEQVSWRDAMNYCEKLTQYARERQIIGADKEFRLPTVEEWQLACAAGTSTQFCSGNDEAALSRVAWWRNNSGNQTHVVGTKLPNAWAIYDMHGNVWEWCLDRSPKNHNNQRCGGSFSNISRDCQTANINSNNAENLRFYDIGFRVVLANVGKVKIDVPEPEPQLSPKMQARKEMLLKIRENLVDVPAKRYALGRFEVSQNEYVFVMEKNPSQNKARNLPVERVSWNDANAFCEKLTQLSRELKVIGENEEYRLPTVAEWEHACRAGTQTRFCNGNSELDLNRVAWWRGNSKYKTHAIGLKAPNEWGFYDMHGNVWEWCLDPKTKSKVACCGGSVREATGYCKSDSVRRFQSNDLVRNDVGFRIVLAPVEKEDKKINRAK